MQRRRRKMENNFTKTELEIIELFKTGDFTIAYHDHGYACIYKGKFEYENLPEKENYSMDNSFAEGYAPAVVILLTAALYGECNSI